MDTSSSSYDIFLVIPANETKSSVSSRLRKTYDALTEKEISSSWMESSQCLQLAKPPNSLFVCDPFSGEAFNHLQRLGCRILGPLCILTCLQDDSSLPKRSRPIYSLNMRHVVVTFSNVPAPKKKTLREKVLLMGGECLQNLTQACTHLVVGSVGSEKYVTAHKLNLPIKMPDWIEACWTDVQKDGTQVRHCTDVHYNSYSCKPFYRQYVSASQLTADERKRISDLVIKNGGMYSGAMRVNETTHLVLETPTGSKFEHAQQWGVKCVKKDWVLDCVAAGIFLNEEKYILLSDKNVRQNKASTPKKDEQPFPAPNCSILVPCDATSRVNETCLSNVSFLLQPAVSRVSASDNRLSRPDSRLGSPDNRLSVPDIKASGPDNRLSSGKKKLFLKQCNMFLCGFNVVEQTEIERDVKTAGGTVSKKFGKSITHIVCSNSKFVPKMLIDHSSPVHVVSQDWLKDCLKAQSCVSETHYVISTNESCSSHGLNLSSITSKEPTDLEISDFKQAEISDFKHPEAVRTDVPLNANADVSEEKENIVRRSDNTSFADTSKPTVNASPSNVFIFSEMHFVVLEPNLEDRNIIVDMLEERGGTVHKPTDTLPETCVSICPALQVDTRNSPLTDTVRSTFWVQMCAEQQMLLPVNQHRLFKPLRIMSTEENVPLKGCVLAFSQFLGSDKECLVTLAQLLGAQCSAFFVRVPNKDKGLARNTHLILVSPEGAKFVAATKWGIPALHKEWLFQAAISNEKPDEGIFSVDKPVPQLLEEDCVVEHDVSSVQTNDESSKQSFAFEDRKDLWVPKFDVSEAVEMLRSRSSSFRVPGNRKRASMTIEELADLNFTQARRNMGIESPAQQLSPPESKARPLAGIFLCVSRKLQSQERRLHSLTERLGGFVLYSYDNSCTHLVHQGKTNEHIGPGSKEFRQALAQSKFIVSPEWLTACEETKSHVDEAEYPYNYNPRLSLSGQIKSEKLNNSIMMSPLTSKVSGGRDPSPKRSPMDSSISKVRSVSVSNSPIQFRKTSGTPVSRVRSVNVSCSPLSKDQNGSGTETTPVDSGKRSEVSRQLEELMTASKKLLSTSPAQRNKPELRNFVVQQPRHIPLGNMEPESQPSQSIPIMWEDPTEKEEREKLARNPPPPRQETQVEDVQPQERQETQGEDVQPREQRKDQNEVAFLDIPTQKVPEQKVFLLTSLKESNSAYIPKVINNLGGELVDAFSDRVTHLICESPSKNQKTLSCLAAGVWILHPSYIHASAKASHFVDEEQHEWGSEAMRSEVQKLPNKIQALSCAPHIWRTRLAKTGQRAFQNWEVVIDVPEHRAVPYESILRAGGATIVQTFSPCSTLTKIAFLEGLIKLDVKVLTDQGAICVKPEYFSAFLLENSAPNPLLFAVTNRDTMKRKSSTSNNSEKKKHC